MPMLLLLLLTGGGLAIARQKGAQDSRQRREAARHYYLTAAQYSALGQNAEAAELYKKHIGSTQPMPRLRCNTECADGEYPPTHCQLP